MTKLLKITGKQQEILKLIYSYRFLNRIQIQAFLGHKDYKTINSWLKGLTQNQFLERIYSVDFVGRTKPAIYYLSLNGIRYLKTLYYVDQDGIIVRAVYTPEQLRKRYKEANKSQAYIDRCLLIADCSLGFIQEARQSQPQAPKTVTVAVEYSIADIARGIAQLHRARTVPIQYEISTQADYLEEDNAYHFLTEGDLGSQLGPQLIITKLQGKKLTDTYLLEVFDTNLPRFRMKNRLNQYRNFLSEGDWGVEREDEPLPIILLVCPRTSDLIYAKRRTRVLLADTWYEDEERPHIHFATAEMLRTHGVCGNIWEEA